MVRCQCNKKYVLIFKVLNVAQYVFKNCVNGIKSAIGCVLFLIGGTWMITGKVKFFLSDKGYGFVTSEDGRDVFVHVTALDSDVQTLEEGQEVTFEIVDGERGQQAANVRLV